MDNLDETGRQRAIGRITDMVLENCPEPGVFLAPNIKNVFLARRDGANVATHCLEKSMAALHLQGHKIINIGTREFHLDRGAVLVNCVDLPCTYILTDASPEHPMLTLYFILDRQILSDLILEMRGGEVEKRHIPLTCGVMRAHFDLVDGFLRLARLMDRPADALVLAPMILRELHYFLLASPLGGMLRNLYLSGARDNRILEALAWLRKNINKPVPIEQLAKTVHMSVSSLHRHFKQITGLSPLQYHKNLRLYEAQRLMLAENERADMAALAVGYESVTQFNREYKRMFGEPPRRDINRRRKNK